MFMRSCMIKQGRMAMEVAHLVHLLVQPVVCCFERGAQLFEAQRVGARGDGIDIGHCPFDLFQDEDGIGSREEGFAFDQELYGAGVRCNVIGPVVIGAAYAQRDPGRIGDGQVHAAGSR